MATVPKEPLKHHVLAEVEATLNEVRSAVEITKINRPIEFPTSLYRKESKRIAATDKVVHFIRHGVGTHNVWGEHWATAGKQGNPYIDPECPIDARLTEKGISEAASALPLLQQYFNSSTEVIVLTSPLRRAIETAQAATKGLNARFLAHELLHEHGGLHLCDRRLNTSALRANYPDVDFSLIESEIDPIWGEGDIRESSSNVLERGYSFMLWLRKLPASHIVVVSHSSFLLHLFNGILTCDCDNLREWFHTGELRSVIISFR